MVQKEKKNQSQFNNFSLSNYDFIELKYGRLPTGIDSCLTFWKAEELHKFAFPASEVMFADLLHYLFFKLASRYVILNEVHRGFTSCVVTEHNLLHISRDALRFSHPDNYWYFPFERAVRRYVTTKCNFKNIEGTFARKEARRELQQHLSRYFEGPPKPFKLSLEKVTGPLFS